MPVSWVVISVNAGNLLIKMSLGLFAVAEDSDYLQKYHRGSKYFKGIHP